MPSIIDKPTSSYFSAHLTANHSKRIGRPKSYDARNVGSKIRTAFMRVFDGLGSWEAMMAWAKDNPDIFYGQVMPKLLPRDQDLRGLGNITVIVQRNADVSTMHQYRLYKQIHKHHMNDRHNYV